MSGGILLKSLFCGLFAAALVAEPLLAFGSACCGSSVLSSDSEVSCPICQARQAKSCCSKPDETKRSCCQSTKADHNDPASGLESCSCRHDVPAEPATPIAFPISHDIAKTSSTQDAGLVADLSATTAGSEAIQLSSAAILLDRSRQSLFCVWRP